MSIFEPLYTLAAGGSINLADMLQVLVLISILGTLAHRLFILVSLAFERVREVRK